MDDDENFDEDEGEEEGEGEDIDDPLYHEIEENVKLVIKDLKEKEELLPIADEFTKLLDHTFNFRHAEKEANAYTKELQGTLADLEVKLCEAELQAQTDYNKIGCQKLEIEHMKKLTDAAHAREQATQEVIINLRVQVTRLSEELKQYASIGTEQVEEMSAEKQREALVRERERLTAECADLRRRVEASKNYQTELERKNSEFDARIQNMEATMALQTSDALRELRIKERLQAQVESLTEDAEQKDEDIKDLTNSMTEMQSLIAKYESQVNSLKSHNVKLSNEHANLTASLQRAHQDLDNNAVALQKQKLQMQGQTKELSKKDDDINRFRIEFSKAEKTKEQYGKKLKAAEGQKFAMQIEKDTLKRTLGTFSKELETAQRSMEATKHAAENAARERDMVKKELFKNEAKMAEMQIQLTAQEAFKRQFEKDLITKALELNQTKGTLAKTERERDKMALEVKDLNEKVEDVQDEVKQKVAVILDLKTTLTETEIKVQQIQHQFETIRSERNMLQRNLQSTTEEGIELKSKVKITQHQVEQLKEDVTCKDTSLIRSENLLGKSEKDKQQLRMDLQTLGVEVQHSKSEIKDLKTQEKALRQEIGELEFDHTKLRKDLDKVQNERDIIGTQLVRRNDELSLLYEKINILQSSVARGEAQYAQRLDDIRLLKLEIQRLRQEKNLLSKTISNQTDLKQEIINLQRDLTKERMKVTALEEEVQTPMNLHRWRRLQGSDPERMELIQKVQILQKRLLQQGAEAEERKADLKEAQQLYLSLKGILSSQPFPGVKERLNKTQRALTVRTTQMKALCAELTCHEVESMAKSNREKELLNQLCELKKLYMEQKSINKRNQELLQGKKSEEMKLPEVASNGSTNKVMGGGFHMN